MKIFLLMVALSAGDMDVEQAEPMWVLEDQSECQQVADILNRNTNDEYLFCLPSYETLRVY